jgi:hypothetical protein
MSIGGRRATVMVVWVAVGVLLIWRGLPYTGLRESVDADGDGLLDIVGLAGNERWIALAAGVVLGIGKGMSALKKGARRAVRQIVDKGEQAAPWTVFSPAMILLVGLMVGAGLALRHAPYDPNVKAWIVGILYPGIGVALIIGGLLALSVEPLEKKA